MSVHSSLRNLTEAEQVTLVQGVLHSDEDAIVTFCTCSQPLLTSLAAHSAVLYNDRAYELQDLAAMALTHLVCGMRLSGRFLSPLQTWLAHREKGIPLATHVANYAHWFLRSLARKRRIETALQRAEGEEIDHNAPDYYENLPDNACAVAEEVAVYRAYRVWLEQRTASEQTLLYLLAPKGEDMTLSGAAQQLGMTIPTLYRRKKYLRDDFVAFLNAA